METMVYKKKFYEQEFAKLLNKEHERKYFIKRSEAAFKIKKFLKKGIDSFELAKSIKESDKDAKSYWTITICYYSMLYMAKAAILTKGYETDDHYATQIALGHLLVPDKIKKEDLELLNQAHKIFEEDYIEYFDDARRESSTSRYSSTKVYTYRRVEDIYSKANKFLQKISNIIT